MVKILRIAALLLVLCPVAFAQETDAAVAQESVARIDALLEEIERQREDIETVAIHEIGHLFGLDYAYSVIAVGEKSAP